mgnify:CR=1 FL=1
MNKNKIIEVIKQCYDPEIPVDLWNLGLIYNIDYKKNKLNKYTVDISMTLTTPGCGMINIIADDLKNKLLNLKDIDEANINITFDPSWEPSMMSEKAKNILGLTTDNKDKNWE